MTVANLDDRDSFEGNGSQTIFPFTFRCVDDAHVTTYVNDVLQESGVKVKRNINGVGGTITFTVAPANGAEGQIIRVSDLLQPNSLAVNEALNTKTLEDMIDKLTIIAQQFQADLTAAVHFAKTVNMDLVSAELPAITPGYLLGFNLDGDGIRAVSPLEAFNDFAPEGEGFGGDVVGPASATANAIAVFNGTGGKTIKNGAAPGTAGNTLQSDGTNWVSAAPAETADVVVPSGTIGLYLSASHIPAGYELCDGQTVTINGSPYVTPDCRGKFLLGASTNDTGSAGFTGADVVAGTISGAKTHTHTQQGTFGSNSANPGSTVNVNAGATYAARYGSLNHSHSTTISGATVANTEASHPISVAILVAIKVDE